LLAISELELPAFNEGQWFEKPFVAYLPVVVYRFPRDIAEVKDISDKLG